MTTITTQESTRCTVRGGDLIDALAALRPLLSTRKSAGPEESAVRLVAGPQGGQVRCCTYEASASAALSVESDVDVDVVVCDVALGDGNGLDLVHRCREQRPTLGLVVLTMHHDDDTLFAALDAGASALVLKSAGLDELVEAVRRAASSPDVFSAAGLAAAMRRRTQAPGPLLTRRESEVLNLLKDGLSVHQVSRRLFLSESTVKTHVAKVYDKLGATNRAQAIMIAVRKGLLDTG